MPLGRQIWPSGVLLHSPLGKWGMQNAVQTRWPYVNFARFPHFNYNVKPKLAGKFLSLVFEFETFCGGSKNIISHFWSKPNWQIKKRNFCATNILFTNTISPSACFQPPPRANNSSLPEKLKFWFLHRTLYTVQCSYAYKYNTGFSAWKALFMYYFHTYFLRKDTRRGKGDG